MEDFDSLKRLKIIGLCRYPSGRENSPGSLNQPEAAAAAVKCLEAGPECTWIKRVPPLS